MNIARIFTRLFPTPVAQPATRRRTPETQARRNRERAPILAKAAVLQSAGYGGEVARVKLANVMGGR